MHNDRKLTTVAGDISIAGDYELHNVSLPALTTVDGPVFLDGNFDQHVFLLGAWPTSPMFLEPVLTYSRIDLPSLKSVSWIRIESTGNISCPALGAAFASLNFTGDDTDLYQGFTCWTGYADNSWDSSHPENNPTTGSGSSSASDTAYGLSVPDLKYCCADGESRNNAANAPRVGWVASLLLLLAWALY